MNWTDSPIEGCSITPLSKFADERGWLAELFRRDELPASLHPVMGYLSLTRQGVSRGPHEHTEQTDLFVFFTGTLRLYLWDHRAGSPTYGHRHIELVGLENPVTVFVPPGVVHAYLNIGSDDALILNCPNRLYGGEGKEGPVDEIRHEDLATSPFSMEL